MIAYADDFVVCFQYKSDAEWFYERLKHRMGHFGLSLEEEKSRLIEFGRFAEENCKRRGTKPETFNFLGFTHYCSKSRSGRFRVKRRKMYAYTLAKQMAAIQRRCKKIESRLSLNQPLVVDETGTLLDIYVYQSYQLENIEIKEFRDGLTLMEHMVLKYLLQERDIENSIGYGYRMRKIIEHAKISLRQKAVEYYGWSYIRSMFA